MRLTYSDIFNIFLDNTQNTGSSDPILKQQFDRFLTSVYQLIRSKLGTYVTERTRTTKTVAGQQYYYKPPGVSSIETVTYTHGGLVLPLTPIHSRQRWDELNSTAISGLPQHFFDRPDDFGIWPIPNDVGTLSMTFHWRDRTPSQADYTTGTVSVTQGETTVTGSGTAFTASMIGRWFKLDANGFWYRIADYVSATELTLETAYDGVTESGASYVIGETPEIPEEGHILLADGVTAMWFDGPRKDPDSAARWWNQFWTGNKVNSQRNPRNVTGGLIGLQKSTSTRANTHIVRRRGRPTKQEDLLRWGTSIRE